MASNYVPDAGDIVRLYEFSDQRKIPMFCML